jgi:hypothetical protein
MIYKIKISPESVSSLIKYFDYSGKTIGVYTGMTNILSGGTNGASTLTGLTIPILLTQDIVDMGYYSEFDGAITQKDVATNFVFSGENDSRICVSNTSIVKTSTLDSTYLIDWGDGQIEQMISPKLCHTYTKSDGEFTLTLTQRNNFGSNIVSKTIKKPFKLATISNPFGTTSYIPNAGPWKNTNINYDYIFTGDTGLKKYSYNDVSSVDVSGYTKSRLNDLAIYGKDEFKVGKLVNKNGFEGKLTEIKETIFTAYTISNIDYIDYQNGITIFKTNIKKEPIYPSPIVKNDLLMKSVSDVQIFSNVFIERGKNSGYERVQRLGEVRTLLDMEKYGYGYFNLTNK